MLLPMVRLATSVQPVLRLVTVTEYTPADCTVAVLPAPCWVAPLLNR